MGTWWQHWGDKDSEERNWPPYLTCHWLRISVRSNRHSLLYKNIQDYLFTQISWPLHIFLLNFTMQYYDVLVNILLYYLILYHILLHFICFYIVLAIVFCYTVPSYCNAHKQRLVLCWGDFMHNSEVVPTRVWLDTRQQQ